MSADIDRIGLSLQIMHETYASLIALGISLWLLWRLLGVSMAASTAWTLGRSCWWYDFVISEPG